MAAKTIELLAPAKNLVSGKLAILSGADAVYIGPEKFGARAKVGNSLEDIQELISFADQYYARVYATINTLLFDDEMEAAVTLVHQLYDAGISGIIIQDMGLLACKLPPVPLIASTQCFINTPAKAVFFQQLGLQRIILPRELSLQQIQEIRTTAADIELEYFIHGALCVSYSGQCYMSYALGGRSGNRGVCAQPCRKKYSIYATDGKLIGKNKHFLSLKDMSQADNLEALIDAGINSFKIEGRLKDENYIKNIVGFYRQKIDQLLERKSLAGSSSGQANIGFSPHIDKTFNRGYSDYFLTGGQQNIAAIDTPKMKGEYLGKIAKIRKTNFVLDQERKLANGDGLCFFDKDRLYGTRINNVAGENIFPDSMHHLKKGLKVFRNYDHEFLKMVDNARPQRLINVMMTVSETAGEYKIDVADEDDNRSSIPFRGREMAENETLAKDMLSKGLQKTGGTIFACSEVKLDLDRVPFLRTAEINHLRRKLLEKLLAERLKNKPVYQRALKNAPIPYVTRALDFRGNVTNAKARQFYHHHGVNEIAPGAELQHDMSGKPLMVTKYCIRKELGRCLLKTNDRGGPDWVLTDEENNEFLLKFHCDICEMVVIKK